jgi:PiT family inorganic phosphate transporter
VDPTFLILVVLVVVALGFDFLNGLHDAANSIATIVSTRVLSAKWAVLWAAFFNFIAFIFFGTSVAKMVGAGIIDPHMISDRLIFAALMGAISWNLITWWAGIPSSSSHALIGGLVGPRWPRSAASARCSGRAWARPRRASWCRRCSASCWPCCWC